MTRVLPVFAFVLAAAFGTPHAYAASTAIPSHQVLPPGAQTCRALPISDVHPYVYEGSVHSFDVSISDASYVAIAGSIGDTPVSFAQMTRWRNADGSVRIHVDVPATSLRKAVPIRVTLLAAHAGPRQATCMAVVSVVVPSASTGAHATQGEGSAAQSAKPAAGAAPVAHAGEEEGKLSPWPFGGAASANRLVTATHSLGNLCATPAGSARLWGVLIVLYAAFAAMLAFQKDNLIRLSREWNLVLVIGVFAALLLFWYASAACRADGSWAPVLATLVACIGLIAVSREEEGAQDQHIPLLKGPEGDPVSLLGNGSGVRDRSAV